MVQIIFLTVLREIIGDFLMVFLLPFLGRYWGFHDAFYWLVRDVQKFQLVLLGLHTSLYRLGYHIHA